jgi:hypothetical protein
MLGRKMLKNLHTISTFFLVNIALIGTGAAQEVAAQLHLRAGG